MLYMDIYGNMDPINIPQMLAYIYIYHTWILWIYTDVNVACPKVGSIRRIFAMGKLSENSGISLVDAHPTGDFFQVTIC